MSKKGDFLSGFSGGNTQKPLTEQKETPVTQGKATESSKIDVKKDIPTKAKVAENKKLADKIVADNEKKVNSSNRVGTPTRPAQSANAIIKAPEHTITKDEKFHKRKMVKYGMIGTISIATIIVIFFLVRILTSVELRNFTGQEIREAEQWGIMNRISIDTEEAYSLELPEGQIISQSHESGTNLARNSVLTLTVSRGPDMNELIELPDFEEMTGAQIRSWRLEYQVMSVTVREEASSEVENNQFIRLEVPNDVDIDEFRRSNSLTIYVSSGPETVQMGSFMTDPNNTREYVENWASENAAITVEFVYEENETVDRDTVLRQSAAPNSPLSEGDTVTVTLSAGLPIIVPNFADIPRDEAAESGLEIGLTVTTRERFSTTIPYGRLISQSVEPGEKLFGEDATVRVTHSLGPPWIGELGMENDIKTALFNFNSQGAWITADVIHVNSYEERGSIVHQSHYNEYLALDSHIVFHISLGNLTRPEPELPDMGPGDDGSDSGLGPDDDGSNFDPDEDIDK